MADTDYLNWPFLEPRHRELALQLDAWAAQNIPQQLGHDVDAACRALVKQLGDAGWLKHAIGGLQYGGASEAIEAEAQAQAICMATNDFHRAYHAFVAKEKPQFEGN